MTETSPVGGMAHPPPDVELGTDEELDWRMKSGRLIAGVQMRIVADDGAELPWDGEAVGEIEVRGPWITGSYHLDAAPEKFDDGWLRTGDIGTIDPRGFFQITDRAKDVIKSGGEWISSVELENLLAGAPGRRRGRGHRHPGREVDRAPARLRRAPRRRGRRRRPALAQFLDGKVAQLAGAGELDVHRRGAQDERRQVRQEGAARPLRRRRLRGRAHKCDREESSRTGIGVDVHPIEPGRDCWLAGLLWPGVDGCAGHSDGDVVAHAACDALLSAAGMGDLGAVFGTSDPQLGRRVRGDAARARSSGCWPSRAGRSATSPCSSSATRRCSARAEPRRRPRSPPSIGGPVSIAATTTDGLGLTGRGEGRAAIATALLIR